MTNSSVTNQEDKAMSIAPATAVAWKIHPAIGIARVGNSPSEFFVAVEALDPAEPPVTGRRDAGDAGGTALPRVKRQAARFRIYAYDASENCLGEVTAESVTAIRWTVTLANKKASGRRIGSRLDGGLDLAGTPRRNRDVPDSERWKLEITPRSRELTGINQRAAFDDGRFMDIPVSLGEIRTDPQGRLLVLGGCGKAGTHDATKRIRSHTDNDGWYDDVSDGPVSAAITLADGRVVSATPSWVIVAPPDFAPGIAAAATLFDALVDSAIRGGFRRPPRRPSFQRDILPILRRAIAMQWLNRPALLALSDNPHIGTGDAEANLAILGRNDATAKPARDSVFAALAKHNAIPGSAKNRKEAGGAVAHPWLKLTRTQFDMLKLWAAGEFESDSPINAGAVVAPAQASHTPEALDRASLDACCPGILVSGAAGRLDSDIFLPEDFLRLDPGKLAAGSITQSMPCPWQADLLEGRTPWSMVRPEQVLTLDTYRAICALDEQIAALPRDATAEAQRRILQDRRNGLWRSRQAWTRGLAAEFPAREESLIKEWQHLGFVTGHGPDGAAYRLAGVPCFVETERNPHLGTMAEYFHRLVNFESHRDFAAKACELTLQMLDDAKFNADPKFAPFHYTPDAFDARLDKIYADLADNVMYNPVPWESGEITWSAVVDYDENDEPIRKERLFHVGRFSDRALTERFRQFAPLNLTDGAWLQNIVAARPMDGVESRLASIWLDESGNGRPELNHSNVYETLLRSLNLYMPPVTAEDFIKTDFVRSAFESPVFQLSIGLFPRRFLPELLGMTLFVEWEATPTMAPIANMMTARHIDPQYYRMHAAIDNINVGHGALAKEAIKLYLHNKQQEGGDAVVQEHWQRIWRGYVAWATLGNGADEVVERMMLVDKKQIRLGSSLLLKSDILPPLPAALRAGNDPLSVYLHGKLSVTTRKLLSLWKLADPPSDELLGALRKDLNLCFRAGIYQPELFLDVQLSSESRNLLKLKPKHGVDLIDLSRSLLEDAYPDGVARRPGFPDVKHYYAARMAELIRRKTSLALQSHRRVGWLMEAFKAPPEELMQALVDRGLVDTEHPAHSRLFEKLEFSGPMYKVFTEEEKAVIIDWIESLRADGAHVARPEPVLAVADPAHEVLALLSRRAAEAVHIGAHENANLEHDGTSGNVLRWLQQGPRALMQALAETPSMVKPGDPDRSPFIELISPSGAMAQVFSDAEVAVLRAWIQQGARIPDDDATETAAPEDAVDNRLTPRSTVERERVSSKKRWKIGMGSVH